MTTSLSLQTDLYEPGKLSYFLFYLHIVNLIILNRFVCIVYPMHFFYTGNLRKTWVSKVAWNTINFSKFGQKTVQQSIINTICKHQVIFEPQKLLHFCYISKLVPCKKKCMVPGIDDEVEICSALCCDDFSTSNIFEICLLTASS